MSECNIPLLPCSLPSKVTTISQKQKNTMTEKDLESVEELQWEKEGRHQTKVIYFLFSFSL